MLSDEQLQKLGMNKYGDCVALMAFAKSAQKSEYTSAKGLLERISRRLSVGGRTKSEKLTGNKNAKKVERQFELGWLNYENGELKQIKSKRGGGTRKLKMSCTTSVEEIMNKGKQLFFPNGTSVQHGPLDDFDVSITSFDRSPIPQMSTIGDLYDLTKVGMLRLYICTKIKDNGSSGDKKIKLKLPTTISADDNNNVQTLPDLSNDNVVSSIDGLIQL